MRFLVDWERLSDIAKNRELPEVVLGRALGLALTKYGLETTFLKGAEYTGHIDWIKVLENLKALKEGRDLSDDDVAELLKSAAVFVTNQLISKNMDMTSPLTGLKKSDYVAGKKGKMPITEEDKQLISGFYIGVLEGFEKGLDAEMSQALKDSTEETLERAMPDVYRIAESIPEEEVLGELTTKEKVVIDMFLSNKNFTDLSEEDKKTVIRGLVKAGEPRIVSIYVRARAEVAHKPPTTNFQLGYDDEEVKRRGPSL